MRGLLQLGVHVFNQLLAVDCLLEQRFQNRQQHLRFIESKGAVGHVCLFYWKRAEVRVMCGHASAHVCWWCLCPRYFCRAIFKDGLSQDGDG